MKKLLLLLICSLALFNLNGQNANPPNREIDLSPAKWIWYPSGRVLQNTFILFRKEINLDKKPEKALGHILADSRYQLFVNGQRVQWGPAPSDPRWQEVDPVDLAAYLNEGKNVIACQVMYYGLGEGTYPMGKPGLLFKLDVDGNQIISDNSWQSYLAVSWQPGHYKRSFLRTLQEEFDARTFPYGWNEVEFTANNDWIPAAQSGASAAKPSICNWFPEYQWEIFGNPDISYITERSIPLMVENDVKIHKLTESMRIIWQRSPEEYFAINAPNAYTAERVDCAEQVNNNEWIVKPDGNKGSALTFEFKEQSVGFPYFTVDAPAGTVIEMLVHEAHKPGGPAIINSHYHSWSRFICKEGKNTFQTFDFESLRWLQLHIHNFNRPVTISNIGITRRQFPWPHTPTIKIDEPALQRLMDASVNTLHNSAQETVVDGMARERQQYSGDGAHQLHSIYSTFGETRLPARFIRTFSQGISLEGYFMDSWPAFDRLARIMERQIQVTGWGPILDHGVGFCFDNYHYYMYTGDTEPLKESYPRLIKFFNYLQSICGTDDLLPVDNLGTPSVWIDHEAFKQQRHKQCAFNLYAAAMCKNALAPLADVFGETEQAETIRRFGNRIEKACVKKYWSTEHKTFVNNLPWVTEEKELRFCDRSLATAILFDQCPDNDTKESVRILTELPQNLGISYPCNAVWPLWAYVKIGRIDCVLRDLRGKWANMTSVIENNTLQEFWVAQHDSWSQWSHCALSPLIMLHQGIGGVSPLKPGYEQCRIRPQLGDLKNISFDVQTVKGAINFSSVGTMGKRELTLTIPTGCEVELLLDPREKVKLPEAGTVTIELNTLKKYTIKGGSTVKLKLKYT